MALLVAVSCSGTEQRATRESYPPRPTRPPEVRRLVHQRCVEALEPGGVMILEAYTPAQVGRGTGGPPNPNWCMSAAGLREELAGLQFPILRERERSISEGKYHRGDSAVVQMVACKPG